MKKKIIAGLFILIASAVAFTAAGCGDNTPSGNNQGGNITNPGGNNQGGNNQGGNSGIVNPSVYVISLNNDDGSQIKTETIYVESGNRVQVPSRGEDIFLGYFTESGQKIFDEFGRQNSQFLIDRDFNLTARWERQAYTIKFDAGEGVLDDYFAEMTVYMGDTITRLFPEPQPEEGYQFDGWYDSTYEKCFYVDGEIKFTQFSGDSYIIDNTHTATLYAKYSVKKFTVTLDYNDMSGKTEQFKVDYGTVLDDLSEYFKDSGSSEITCWSLSYMYEQPLEEAVISDITLYAIWREYKLVNFVYDIDDIRVQKYYNDNLNGIKLPTDELPGKELDGWYTNNTFSGNPSAPSVAYGMLAETYYAKWTPAIYSVEFRGDDYFDSLTYDIDMSLDLPVPDERDDSEFLGWCKTADMSDTPILEIKIGSYGNLVLYPKWQKYSTNLSLVVDTQTVNTQNLVYGERFNLPVPTLADKQVFQCWYAMLNGVRVDLTDEHGNGLFVWNRKEKNLSARAEYLQKQSVSVKYDDPVSGETVTNLKGWYLPGASVSINPPSALTGYVIRGYYINNERVSEEERFNYTVGDSSVIIEVRYSLRQATEVEFEEYGFPIYEYNTHYYSLVKRGAASWNDAKLQCEFFGGHLVTITSAEENAAVISIMKFEDPGNYNYWLGATDSAVEGTWVWVTGEPFEFKNWSQNQPDNLNNEDFLAYYANYTWNDSQDVSNRYFVIEWDSASSIRKPVKHTVTISDGSQKQLNVYEYGGKYYAYVDAALNWVNAEKYCEYIGGHLATIANANENNFVYYLLKNTQGATDIVFGGTDEETEGTWKWVTGEAFGYKNWNSGQPDNANKAEHYLHMYIASGKWNDCTATFASAFVCEWEKLDDIGVLKAGNFIKPITTPEELRTAAGAAGNRIDYFLANDIDMEGEEWTPGTFAANLDGKGFAIKNLTLASDSGNLGVFTTVSGTIKNITFENLSITSTAYEEVLVGGLCAELNGGMLDNVVIKGQVTGDRGRTGGIVGKVTSGTVKNCSNYATVKGSLTQEIGSAGGITGWLAGGSLNGCVNYGEILKGFYAGGITGLVTSVGLINVSNEGVVSGKKYLGGIIGSVNINATYTIDGDLTNKGSVTGEEQVGGIIGRINISIDSYGNNAAVTLSRVTNTGNITASGNYAAGIIGYLNIWNSSSGAPVLTGTMAINTGNVVANNADCVGGLFGYFRSEGNSTVNGYEQTGIVTGKEDGANIGELVGSNTNLTIND